MMIYRAVQLIQIFLAHGGANELTDEGPRGPKNSLWLFGIYIESKRLAQICPIALFIYFQEREPINVLDFQNTLKLLHFQGLRA